MTDVIDVVRRGWRCEGKKGQAAVEFYTFLSLFIFMFGYVSYTFLTQSSLIASQMRQEVGNEVASSYANMINLAVSGGDGFYGSFRIPSKKVMDTSYRVNITSNVLGVFVTANGRNYVFIKPTTASSVSGVTSFTSDAVDCICLRNMNGTINISVSNSYPCCPTS